MAVRKQEYDDNHAGTSENDSSSTLEISPELRRRIKKAAAESNLSIEEYLEQAVQLEEGVPQAQKKPITQEKLAQILQASEQIMQHTKGQIFEDPAEVIRKMREERLQELE